MSHKRWKPGYAERAYDMMVLLGLNPVPWQHDFMRRIEDADVDAEFRDIARNRSTSERPPVGPRA